jgi:hypothetical protein
VRLWVPLRGLVLVRAPLSAVEVELLQAPRPPTIERVKRYADASVGWMNLRATDRPLLLRRLRWPDIAQRGIARPAKRGSHQQRIQDGEAFGSEPMLRPILAGVAAVFGLAACSANDPDPSPLYDGQYVGTRQSNGTISCGVGSARGTTSAQVTRGRLTMLLFDPKTELDGTVGADGRLRASGIWRTPAESYPQITVLNGSVKDDRLQGHANDFRCDTSLMLHKVVPRRPGNPSS